MKITLLCNAGLALETADAMLLVDLPNTPLEPFYTLPETTWSQILNREKPFDKVCGFWFSHLHPDHCCREKIEQYLEKWPSTQCFFPEAHRMMGHITMGPFHMEFCRVPHAPIPEAPIHVATVVTAGESRLYLPADSELDCEVHRKVLDGRHCNAAIWNSMYLSRPDTRLLMQHAAERNFIYHMPAGRTDTQGLWKKLERNMERFGAELSCVTVLDTYPSEIHI